MLHVLIVEDNIKLRSKLRDILESRLTWVTLAEAASSKEAFREIRNKPPDFIIMDIGLIGENGLKLTQKIKRQHPHIIVAIYSNYDSLEYREEAVRSGADYFFSKTTNNIQDLIGVLESIGDSR